jgi:hypothetical protein
MGGKAKTSVLSDFDRGKLRLRVWDGTEAIPPRADKMLAATSAFWSIVLGRRKKNTTALVRHSGSISVN